MSIQIQEAVKSSSHIDKYPTLKESNSNRKNRWEDAMNEFNDGNYANPNIIRYFEDIKEVKPYVLKDEPINIGIQLDEEVYWRYINNLPTVLKEDYIYFRKYYCITKYRTIIEISKILYGKNGYQFDLQQKKNLELYFYHTTYSDGKYSIQSNGKLINIPLSYEILQTKVQTKVDLINTQDNYKSVYVHGKEGKIIIMNLPYYEDFTSPLLVFYYLELITAFANEYLYCSENEYVICPVHILNYLYQYCKQLQYIEQNCF